MQSDLPELKKSEIDKIIDSYKAVYQSEKNVINAHVVVKRQDDVAVNIIYSEWIQRNLERGVKMKISRLFIADKCFTKCTEIDTNEISDCALTSYFDSGNSKAIIKKIRGRNGFEYFLEIWADGNCKNVFDLTALEVHGEVHIDGNFASLSWSREGDKLLYIAEEKPPVVLPFYPPLPKCSKECIEPPQSRGEQYTYEDNWGETIESGEGHVPKKKPVIVVCDLNKETISVLKGVPKNVCPGQVRWIPFTEGVVGVGYINEPRRLGLYYCMNRKSHIFYLTRSGEYRILSDHENMAAFSPRFSPTGKYLVWLQRPYSGTTLGAQSIIKYHWLMQKKFTLVDITNAATRTENGKEFCGVHSTSLPTRCWSFNGRFFFFSTPQRNRINTYAVDTENGKIWDVGSPKRKISTILLDVTENDFLIFNTTSFKRPSSLSSLFFPTILEASYPEYMHISLTDSFVESHNMIKNFAVYSEKEGKETCTAIYYGPRSSENESIPVVLYVHGGPHISSPSVYTPILSFFAALGFGVVIVNYRGSAGCGQHFIDSLVGNIGSVDVDDCYSCVVSALKKFPWLDPNSLVIFGGSHGGFIGTHLTSQYPTVFKALATRNPNVDVYARCFLSDISDWSLVENGFPYEGLMNVVDNFEVRKKLMDVSPIKNIKNVQTPTLLLLGKKDLRIPPGPAIAYHNILKEMNVPTKILFYDDNHNLFSFAAEMDSAINSAIWFKQCLKK